VLYAAQVPEQQASPSSLVSTLSTEHHPEYHHGLQPKEIPGSDEHAAIVGIQEFSVIVLCCSQKAVYLGLLTQLYLAGCSSTQIQLQTANKETPVTCVAHPADSRQQLTGDNHN
jgi:hypothetical protein